MGGARRAIVSTMAPMVRLPLPSAERMKFRALADLGQGALGPMRLVRVESGRYNGRLFALQRVDPAVSADWQLASAILDEALITAVVFSRNVVQFIAWGHDDEGTYIAIELVQGASLRPSLSGATSVRSTAWGPTAEGRSSSSGPVQAAPPGTPFRPAARARKLAPNRSTANLGSSSAQASTPSTPSAGRTATSWDSP